MGKKIDYSRKLLKYEPKGMECSEALEFQSKLIKDIYEYKISRIRDFKSTSDYKKYGLIPGQQIRRYFTTWFPHGAIYIYSGIIFEMGSGPSKCKGAVTSRNVVGLSTLDDFIKYSRKYRNLKSIVAVETNFDDNPGIVRKRFKKMIKLAGDWKYNAIFANCLHVVNYITFDKFSMFYPTGVKVNEVSII